MIFKKHKNNHDKSVKAVMCDDFQHVSVEKERLLFSS